MNSIAGPRRCSLACRLSAGMFRGGCTECCVSDRQTQATFARRRLGFAVERARLRPRRAAATCVCEGEPPRWCGAAAAPGVRPTLSLAAIRSPPLRRARDQALRTCSPGLSISSRHQKSVAGAKNQCATMIAPGDAITYSERHSRNAFLCSRFRIEPRPERNAGETHRSRHPRRGLGASAPMPRKPPKLITA